MSRNILQGLVGAWCPSLGPSGYTLLDRSGRGNHGTLTNTTASAWAGTSAGWGLKLNGSNNYASAIRGNYALANEYTIAAWIYRTTTPSTGIECVLNNYYVTSSPNVSGFDLRMYTDAGVQKIGLVGSNGSAAETGSDLNYTWTLNQWTHIAFVRRAGAGRFYANGVDVSAATIPNDVTTYGTFKTLQIGRFGSFNSPSDLGRYLNATVGDITIHARGLGAAEISAAYILGPGGLGRLLTQRAQRRVFRTAQGNRRRRLICGAEC